MQIRMLLIKPNKAFFKNSRTVVEAEATPEPVELKPWETRPLSARINDLMRTEGLSRDAAIVIVMTERNTNPVDPDSAPTIDESWRADHQTQTLLLSDHQFRPHLCWPSRADMPHIPELSK